MRCLPTLVPFRIQQVAALTVGRHKGSIIVTPFPFSFSAFGLAYFVGVCGAVLRHLRGGPSSGVWCDVVWCGVVWCGVGS